jgi:predicted nucleic acid-binding protein
MSFSPRLGLNEVWVVDSSPVIILAKAGRLNLLEQLSADLLIPLPVRDEILEGPPSDPAWKALRSGWGQIVVPGPVPGAVLEWGLGAGESSALALALAEPGRAAVLDDAAARACARTLGVRYLGTLAVVLRAKQAGLIESAANMMVTLRQAGLRLDEGTLRTALERIGERWPA